MEMMCQGLAQGYMEDGGFINLRGERKGREMGGLEGRWMDVEVEDARLFGDWGGWGYQGVGLMHFAFVPSQRDLL